MGQSIQAWFIAHLYMKFIYHIKKFEYVWYSFNKLQFEYFFIDYE